LDDTAIYRHAFVVPVPRCNTILTTLLLKYVPAVQKMNIANLCMNWRQQPRWTAGNNRLPICA
jgi:hypothetical protein